LIFALLVVSLVAQTEVTDSDLEAASGGRVVRVGALSNDGRVTEVPLEVYVARVLAGEGEPQAPDAAYQALAVAIRTFALANPGRHAGDGFDLCDTTHCQVPRMATPATRHAALATAGQIVTYNGRPAEVFYSASCGGRSERASDVWPGADFPYLASVRDEVHEHDEPWTVELTLREIQQALRRAGFEGQRLRDVRIEARSGSGRATRLGLSGLRPDVIAGDQFRAAVGATELRSTAFSVKKRGNILRFTGRGFGHGVGMCVIGAGRRASRGDSVKAILNRYFPGLEVARVPSVAPPAAVATAPVLPPVPVPPPAGLFSTDVGRIAARAREELSKALGTAAVSITIRVHESLESFRLATGRPWWVNAVSSAKVIELAPVAVLEQRDGLEASVRIAIAELLVSEALSGRPAWVRVGAARHFGRPSSRAPPVSSSRVRCPSDAELTAAVSATAQREAEARAEACFAREYAETGDWRWPGPSTRESRRGARAAAGRPPR
jgi:stage II sporulation protein D